MARRSVQTIQREKRCGGNCKGKTQSTGEPYVAPGPVKLRALKRTQQREGAAALKLAESSLSAPAASQPPDVEPTSMAASAGPPAAASAGPPEGYNG